MADGSRAEVAAGRIVGRYRILGTLGSGAQGKVKKAQKRDGSIVALKLIDKSTLNAENWAKLRRETKIMLQCKHRHIVGYFGCDSDFKYTKRDGTIVPCVLMEIEYAAGRELFSYLSLGRFPEDIARIYFQQAINAIGYCHSKGITHRDIKAENMLLDQNFDLKIADFGFSAMHETPTWLETQCGTKIYMAPEIVAGKLYDGPLTDVWSMGVILFIMLAGYPPFSIAQVGDWWFNRVCRSDYKEFWRFHLRSCEIAVPARDLLNKIFVVDPSKRFGIQNMSVHPWVHTGRALPIEATRAEMSRRLAKILALGRAEKEKKRLERRRQQMEAHATGAGAAAAAPVFNPDTAIYRSHSREEGAAKLPKAMPVPAAGVSQFYSLHVRDLMGGGAPEILKRLKQSLSKLSAKTTILAGYKLKTEVPTPQCTVRVTIQVYADGDKHVVELRRRSGDLLVFQKLYRTICSDLEDIETAE